MRTAFVLTALAVATPALAKLGVADFPGCATLCAVSSIAGTPCSLTDTTCTCENPLYLKNVQACIRGPKGCTVPADLTKTLEVTNSLCEGYAGYPVPLPGSGAASSAASSPAASSPASSSPAASPSSTMSTAAAASPSVAAPVVLASNSTASNGSAPASPSPTVEVSTGGADQIKVGMGLVALVGFVAAAI